jgi:hypothetical protein
MSRDTLLLLGALTFLILAVALTFLFTPNSGQNPADATAVAAATAGAPTAAAPYPAGSPDAALTPILGAPGEVTPVGGATGFLPTVPAYPGPGGEGAPTAAQPATIPTGDPLAEPSPTSGAAGGAIATPTGDAAAVITPTAPGADAQTSPTTGAAYPGPVGEGTPPPQPTFNPTVVQPTVAPLPTVGIPVAPTAGPPPVVQPTAAPAPTFEQPPTTEPTSDLSLDETPTSEAPASPTVPPPPPADVLRGNVRWAAGQSPIILRRDVQVAPGAELIIEPGVEVRLDPGVSIFVDGGRMLALGLPGSPVRFVGGTGARWSGIFGRPGSFVVLEHAEVRGGGAGGTVMAVERSDLVVRASRFNDNGGAILLTDTKLEMTDSEVSGNDMPFGAALDATYGRGNFLTMRGNRFGGNRLGDGAPQVRIANTSTFETLNLAIDGNLLRGGTPNLQLLSSGVLKGDVTCNGLVGDGLGFGLRTQTPQVAPNGRLPMPLRVESNFIDDHVPPIVPVYLRFGLGRGATSEIFLDMRNNWWGAASGPYEPEQNPEGRGDSVGVNILFAPWLQAPPPCAPAS